MMSASAKPCEPAWLGDELLRLLRRQARAAPCRCRDAASPARRRVRGIARQAATWPRSLSTGISAALAKSAGAPGSGPFSTAISRARQQSRAARCLRRASRRRRSAAGRGEGGRDLLDAEAIGVGLDDGGDAHRRADALGEQAPIRGDGVEIDLEDRAGAGAGARAMRPSVSQCRRGGGRRRRNCRTWWSRRRSAASPCRSGRGAAWR